LIDEKSTLRTFKVATVVGNFLVLSFLQYIIQYVLSNGRGPLPLGYRCSSGWCQKL